MEKTTDDISNEIVEKDKLMMSLGDSLDIIQIEKHNLEIKLMGLSEAVRQQKRLIRKTRLEKEILEREYWSAKNK